MCGIIQRDCMEVHISLFPDGRFWDTEEVEATLHTIECWNRKERKKTQSTCLERGTLENVLDHEHIGQECWDLGVEGSLTRISEANG